MLLQTLEVKPQQLMSETLIFSLLFFLFSDEVEPSPPTAAQIRYGERLKQTHTHVCIYMLLTQTITEL